MGLAGPRPGPLVRLFREEVQAHRVELRGVFPEVAVAEIGNGAELSLGQGGGDLIFQIMEYLGYPVAAQTVIDYHAQEVRFHSSVTGRALQTNSADLLVTIGRRLNFADIRELQVQIQRLNAQNQALTQELEGERRKVRDMLDAVNGYSLRAG